MKRSKKTPGPCVLPAELTIQSALQVQADLLKALAGGCTAFDAAGVDAIDTAGVQLLVAVERSVGDPFRLLRPSTAVRQAWALYALGELAGLTEEAGA